MTIRRRSGLSVMGLAAIAGALGGGMGIPGLPRLDCDDDIPKPKTQHDLDAIEKAAQKRARKAVRKEML